MPKQQLQTMIKEIAHHRSIRKFRPTEIPAETVHDILQAATRASTVGNMQLYSIVVTTDKQLREQLAPCHFNQPMVTEAPMLLTFCADINRFSHWCRVRGAEPRYDNFVWYVNAVIDAMLAAEMPPCRPKPTDWGSACSEQLSTPPNRSSRSSNCPAASSP